MLKEFKAFLIKQNAIALAIAVVIGVALNGVVTSIVDGLVMPLVAAISPVWQGYLPSPFRSGYEERMSAGRRFVTEVAGALATRP